MIKKIFITALTLAIHATESPGIRLKGAVTLDQKASKDLFENYSSYGDYSSSEDGNTPRTSHRNTPPLGCVPDDISIIGQDNSSLTSLPADEISIVSKTFHKQKIVGSITMANSTPIVNIDVSKVLSQLLALRGLQDVEPLYNFEERDIMLMSNIKKELSRIKRDIGNKSIDRKELHGASICVSLESCDQGIDLQSYVLMPECTGNIIEDKMPCMKDIRFLNTVRLEESDRMILN